MGGVGMFHTAIKGPCLFLSFLIWPVLIKIVGDFAEQPLHKDGRRMLAGYSNNRVSHRDSVSSV